VPLRAFLLVFIAALAHSTWNLLAKRASEKRHLIWFSSLGETILFLPLAIWILKQSRSRVSLMAAIFLLATGVLHVFYTYSLQRAYRVGDLSVVYPLARGAAPLLSFCGAILFLREHPSWLATLGALLVSFGILLLSNATTLVRSGTVPPGLVWGALTGLIIAGYTLTDAYSVKVLALSPVLVEYSGNLFRTLVLAPKAWRDRARVRQEYPSCWRESLGISVLTPVGYILVLFSMKFAPVTHIAPVREMSMMEFRP
jgi:drug/metabolite transporter (DMT)-like permease